MLKVLRLQFAILFGAVVVCEIALQLLAISPAGGLLEPVPLWVSDPTLRFRGNPRYPEHDARGYRNREALTSADIVAIGDSHTYGIGVKREEAWPALLSARTKRTVYSMAHGGYGPGQYERMLPEGLALRPKIAIVGVHLGNDFSDAYYFSKGDPAPPHLAKLAAQASARDQESSIESEAARLYWHGNHEPGVRQWLGDHVELYRFAHQIRRRIEGTPPRYSSRFEEVVPALTPSDRQFVSVFSDGAWRTVLRARYSRLGLNQSDPRIRLGFERTLLVLEAMASGCRRAGVSLVVVLIPTKESVFWPRVRQPAEHPQLPEMVQDERVARERLLDWLHRADIPAVDPLPALQASSAQPYQESLDGHPNAIGHQIIADLVAEALSNVRAGAREPKPVSARETARGGRR